MKSHQQHLVVVSFHCVDVSDQGNLFQETGKSRIFIFFLIGYDLRDQLVNVLDPGFCLFRTLRFQLVYIACLLDDILQKSGRGQIVHFAPQTLDEGNKRLDLGGCPSHFVHAFRLP